jgi:small conductance mechanosensitive channel
MTPSTLVPISPETLAGAAIVIFVLAALAVWIGRRFVNQLLSRLEGVAPEATAELRGRARQVVGALAVAAFGIAGIATASLVLSRAGFAVPDYTPTQIVSWLLSRGLHALIIIAGAYITLRIASLLIERFKFSARGDLADPSSPERVRRAATLGSIVSSLVTAAVWFFAVLMVLRELSIDIVPLLTGAGIAGLAIGFGAQNLVRDVISGFFMILEDQVGVGDVARIQNVTGVVEEIKLRTIVLRDSDGTVHVFPNGTITTLANLSKDFAYAVADVVVAHGENVERAMSALRNIGTSMVDDREFAPLLLGPLEILGVQEMRETSLTLRVRFKTQPMKQFLVASELRRRIALGFAARNIKPFRQV